MTCVKCDKDLAKCLCPDLEERFLSLCRNGFLAIGEDYAQRIKKQIERNKQHNTERRSLSE
jgi:hypothetical protein